MKNNILLIAIVILGVWIFFAETKISNYKAQEEQYEITIDSLKVESVYIDSLYTQSKANRQQLLDSLNKLTKDENNIHFPALTPDASWNEILRTITHVD